ncbi:MAG: 1-acyl-sn-glycerol-3-phosphate acyltransferase [Proteobacteria bacterium]|nr:1-acyl-sn-glycerol-3-phosphate acyltransferase [Pseudomonadota bacterium]
MTWSPEIREALNRFRPYPTKRGRTIAFTGATLAKFIMRVLNHTEFMHLDNFTQAQASGRGVLTLSNHVSIFDDPLLTACFSTTRWPDMRWAAVDVLNFFSDEFKAAIFNGGKAVPIIRGGGIDQPGMTFMKERLAAGDWVHVFPEGTRTRHDAAHMGPLKPGFAHLIKATQPLVLPFHHRGMHEVLPVGGRIPKMGKRVVVRFGEVVDSAEGLADASISEIIEWAEQTFAALESTALAQPAIPRRKLLRRA